ERQGGAARTNGVCEMLSEDKVSHLSHVILQAVKRHRSVTLRGDDERVLKEIKRVLAAELAQEAEIDRKVKAKLASYSRGIVEGSAEWEVLYRKTFEEETRKRAL
ncbi:MAG: DUF507 family protein, partial [Nitrospira sp.]|nr:DUF507 family protein [Nitrospira sp.]